MFNRFGGPEVLFYGDHPTPAVPAGAVQVKMAAAGLNFADIYRRRGDYPLADRAPHIGGYEGVGYVTAVGAEVTGWHLGQRVGFADVPFAHATRVNVPVDRALKLPDDIGDVAAAAILLQGLTAQYLINDSVRVAENDRVLVLAAAGGVGQHLTRLMKARGARVYAVASTRDKQRICLANGALAAYGYDDNWAERVREATGGGVEYVFDSVGSTLPNSLAALHPGGRVVLFGMSGGAAPALAPSSLMMASKGVIGGDLWTYLGDGAQRASRARALFSAWRRGWIAPPAVETFPLSAGAGAHRRLEDRHFAGKIVLLGEED
ncbi:quinone oxidoreductase family protein [Sodalis sp. C49]|uniref:quinone oxidoreductase family protein n=1 Tax=Sodalis sp. C49 TaxID=3228929 RepID=UPI003965D3BD